MKNPAPSDSRVVLITGARKGIGLKLAEHFLAAGDLVVGVSRSPVERQPDHYRHFALDVSDEDAVRRMFSTIRREYGRLDVLINNAGIASMNHTLLTPADTARQIMETNFLGTFVLSREAAKLMRKRNAGRIVNVTTVAVPLRLDGEAVYASSKAAVETFTRILARELSEFGITVNAVGPTPVPTDLIKAVPSEKMRQLIARQAIPRFGEFRDVLNVVDFFLRPESDFVTGQVMYLGGVG